MTLKELRLKKKKEDNKFTQTYMARELKVSLKSYIMYEDGVMGLSVEKKEKLEEILGEEFN